MEIALEIVTKFLLAAIVILIIYFIVSAYNGLVSLRNNIDNAWANIDVLLKQRSDLIPNLVSTVKGYMTHEKEVLLEITRLRTKIAEISKLNEKAVASESMSAALANLFAVSENYPKLRANENFLELQNQITAIENQIADRREFYNNSVLLYNTRIGVLPDSILAAIMRFTKKEYFKAVEEEKKNVDVVV